MKTIFVSMVLLGLTAGAFALISLTGDKRMILENKNIKAAGGTPPIDAHIPGRIETATFALG
jgi:hypothetical protein